MSGRCRVKSRVSEQTWIRVFRTDAVTAQNGACAYCRCPITVRTATGDHRKARKLGGTTERENIDAACYDCNQAKGHMTPAAFKSLLKHPPAGGDIRIWMAWSRRRLFLATERSCKRIMGVVA